jgi:hypothetical protein
LVNGDPVLPSRPFTANELREFLRANPDCERIYLFAEPSLERVCARFGFIRHIARPIVSLDLSLPEETLWSDLRGKRRNGIRYARKHDVVVEVATPAERDGAIKVFVDGYGAKHGIPAERICPSVAYWIDRRNLLLARLGDRGPVIACVSSLDGHDMSGPSKHFKPGVYSLYSANSSLLEYQKYKPNDLLVWEAALRAKAAGYQHFVLGSRDAQFKREFSRGHIVVNEWVRRKSLVARLVAKVPFWPIRGDKEKSPG